MEGTVTRTDRHGISVLLDPEDRSDGRTEVALPAAYVATPDQLAYAYALTADKAQGATIDHSLFAADGTGSLERGYVALSRGSETNRIYATADTGWQDALATPGAHTLALHQHPDPSHPAIRRLLGATPDLADHPAPGRAAIRRATEAAATATGRIPTNRQRDGLSPEVAGGELGNASAGLSLDRTRPRERPPRGAASPGIAM